ncbi:N-acetylmuramoyl-L-alanine amidase [Candidatus Jorgensenbacteria bacterium]|nr:N-acetylmuramoyl-L-alanine amidase [Candidatus Jorgensenbacteria bacterium]
MVRIRLCCIILALVAPSFVLGSSKVAKQKAVKGSLYGLVLILDPGHGGQDPGSHGSFRSSYIVENEYVYDVAKRVERLAREQGAIVFKTIRDEKFDYYRDWPAQQVLLDNREEVFSFDGSRVEAGSRGLGKRIAYANNILKRYPRHRVVFLSVHFDVAEESKDGTYLIIGGGRRPRIASLLIDSFHELAADVSVKVAGQGVKHIYVLGKRNAVLEKVLLELGNFNSENDNWEIRNYQTRTRYALRIVKALEYFMDQNKPQSKNNVQDREVTNGSSR